MKEDKNILDQINRKSGMTTPENYFADFAEKMMQSLPEKQEPEIKPLTTWQRVRPYAYLAAMFAGIWCMVEMVDLITSSVGTPIESNEQIVAEALTDDAFFDEYCYEDFNEYSLLETMYDDEIAPEDITSTEIDSNY